MWSASDQPRERLSARGWRVGGVEDGRAHLKSFEYRKRIEADTLKSALKERKKKKINKLLQVLRIKRFLGFFF